MDTIIDGYNVIFQCGLEGRFRNTATIERARNRLFAFLESRMSEEQRSRTTIVFDAKTLPIKETRAISSSHGMTIIYAVDHDEADSLIEELIQKNATPKRLTVVSSDHRLQRAARRRKATSVDSDVWYDRLEILDQQNRSEESSSTAKRTADMDVSDKEITDNPIPEGLEGIDWAKEFGLDET